jgi:hypothetical protein
MNKTVTIYIGSNNDSKQLELDKICKIANKRHAGFTLYTATGYWLGSEEATAVLIIHDAWSKIIRTISDLKLDLDQDAIGYQEAPTLQFA